MNIRKFIDTINSAGDMSNKDADAKKRVALACVEMSMSADDMESVAISDEDWLAMLPDARRIALMGLSIVILQTMQDSK